MLRLFFISYFYCIRYIVGDILNVYVHSIVWPTIKLRRRYNTGIDLKQTEWYKALHNPLLIVPDSYRARQFQRRFRLPYPLFLILLKCAIQLKYCTYT